MVVCNKPSGTSCHLRHALPSLLSLAVWRLACSCRLMLGLNATRAKSNKLLLVMLRNVQLSNLSKLDLDLERRQDTTGSSLVPTRAQEKDTIVAFCFTS